MKEADGASGKSDYDVGGREYCFPRGPELPKKNNEISNYKRALKTGYNTETFQGLFLGLSKVSNLEIYQIDF